MIFLHIGAVRQLRDIRNMTDSELADDPVDLDICLSWLSLICPLRYRYVMLVAQVDVERFREPARDCVGRAAKLDEVNRRALARIWD